MLSLIVPGAAHHAASAVLATRLATVHIAALAGAPDPAHLASARLFALGTAPPGATTFNKVVNWVKWVGGALAGVSLVVVGITLMVQHHTSTGVSHAARVAKVFIGMMLISASTAIAAVLVH